MSVLPSLTTRVIQVCCAITWCLVAAGPVFGYAALKPILIAEGIYEHKCDLKPQDSVTKCVDQDLSLNFLFTLACMVTNISALPVGSILDTYGPKITGIIGSIVIGLGSLSLKYGSSLSIIDGYLIGYSLLALGGPFVFISCFQLANSFPKNSGLILALLTGAFDSSSALFLGYRLLYFKIKAVPLSTFFGWFLIVPVFIFVCQLTIMPSDSYKTVGTLAKIAETAIDETGRPLDSDLLLAADRDASQSRHDHSQPTINETTALLLSKDIRRASLVSTRSSAKSVYEQQADDELVHKSGGVYGILHGYPAIEQLKSSWFILLSIFITVQMLRINYFVATIKNQERYLYDDEDIATTINHVFDIALPLGGLVAIPFIGLILDNLTTLVVLIILTLISVFVGIMGLMSYLPATYAGILIMVAYRPFYYTAISHLFSIIFGFDNFGVLYGSAIAISGGFNILQQVLDRLTQSYYQGNPTPINSMLTIFTGVIGLTLIFFVRSQEAQIKRKNLEYEAEGAPVVNIPN